MLGSGPWFCGLVACLLLALSLVEIKQLSQVGHLVIEIQPADVELDDLTARGELRHGVPIQRRRWDGEPAQAVLIELRSGDIVAPPLLSEDSLRLNRRGVVWQGQTCRYVVDRPTYDRAGDTLAIRFEQLRSRATFYMSTCAGLAFCLLGLALRHVARSLQASPPRDAMAFDLCRLTIFFALSLVTGLAFFPGIPTTRLDDSTNINGFAAALQAPAEFADDAVMSEDRNFRWYTPLYVRGVQGFAWLGFHYDTSRAFLAFATSLIALFGFDRLFRSVSRSALFAFVAAVGIWFLDEARYLLPGEVWSPTYVLPRTVYSAFVPWVVLLAIRTLRRPRWWALPAAASAMLFYIHPVSSPALTGAVLTGLVCGGPGSKFKRLAWGGLAALVAIGVMLPYTMVYMSKYSSTIVQDPAVMAKAIEICVSHYGKGYLDLAGLTHGLANFVLDTRRLWPGVLALAWLAMMRRQARPVRLALGMGLGFSIVTFLIPAFDVLAAELAGRLQFQVDLIRNVRYLDIFSLCFVAVAVREFRRISRTKNSTFGFQFETGAFKWSNRLTISTSAAIATIVIVACYARDDARSFHLLAHACRENIDMLGGRFSPSMQANVELNRGLTSLRRPHEVVYGPLHLRQLHIPIAVTRKDLNVLSYSNPIGLIEAHRTLQLTKQFDERQLGVNEAQQLAAIVDAEILVLAADHATRELLDSDLVLFHSGNSLVCRVAANQRSAQRHIGSNPQ